MKSTRTVRLAITASITVGIGLAGTLVDGRAAVRRPTTQTGLTRPAGLVPVLEDLTLRKLDRAVEDGKEPPHVAVAVRDVGARSVRSAAEPPKGRARPHSGAHHRT